MNCSGFRSFPIQLRDCRASSSVRLLVTQLWKLPCLTFVTIHVVVVAHGGGGCWSQFIVTKIVHKLVIKLINLPVNLHTKSYSFHLIGIADNIMVAPLAIELSLIRFTNNLFYVPNNSTKFAKCVLLMIFETISLH